MYGPPDNPLNAVFCYTKHKELDTIHLARAINALQKEGVIDTAFSFDADNHPNDLERAIFFMCSGGILERAANWTNYQMTETARELLGRNIDKSKYTKAVNRFDALVNSYIIDEKSGGKVKSTKYRTVRKQVNIKNLRTTPKHTHSS